MTMDWLRSVHGSCFCPDDPSCSNTDKSIDLDCNDDIDDLGLFNFKNIYNYIQGGEKHATNGLRAASLNKNQNNPSKTRDNQYTCG